MSHNSRFQFTLGGLLLVTTVACFVFPLLPMIIQPWQSIGVESLVAFARWTVATGAVFTILLWCFCSLRRRVENASLDDLDSPQTVATFANQLEASLVVAELRSSGIRTSAVGGYTAAFQAEAPGVVRIVVAREQRQRAQDVLAQFQSKEVSFDWSRIDVGEMAGE